MPLKICKMCGRKEGEVKFQPRHLKCYGCLAAIRWKKEKEKKRDPLDFDIDEAVPEIKLMRAVTKVAQAKLSKLTRILFIPDTHVPYHDRAKFDLMLRAAEYFKPEIMVILGDFADFYAVSSHDKRPDRKRVLKDELVEVHEELKRLTDAAPDARKIYIAGNHEDRYDRYINARAPEFFDMMALRDVLKLKEKGWEYVPYKTHIAVGKLNITHDTGKAGATAHRSAHAAFQTNVLIGHTHRIAYEVIGNAEGKPNVAAMLGWLGDVEAVDYMHRITMMSTWAHGFGIGYMMENEAVYIVPVPIIENTCIIEGKLIT